MQHLLGLAAISGLWVTRIRVWPKRAAQLVSSSMVSSRSFLSRLPVGSSAMISSGFASTDRAMAARCCWPPDSSEGNFSAYRTGPACPPPPQKAGSGLRWSSFRGIRMLFCAVFLQQVEALEHKAHVAAAEHRPLCVRHGAHILALQRHLAAGGLVQPARMCKRWICPTRCAR